MSKAPKSKREKAPREVATDAERAEALKGDVTPEEFEARRKEIMRRVFAGKPKGKRT